MNLDRRGPYELRGQVRFFEPDQVILVGHMPATDPVLPGQPKCPGLLMLACLRPLFTQGIPDAMLRLVLSL
jgi:hypothetical protein